MASAMVAISLLIGRGIETSGPSLWKLIMDRDQITFLQAEGIEPLPRQLDLKELPNSTKSKLWALVYALIRAHESSHNNDVIGKMWQLAYIRHVEVEHRMIDEFNPDYRVLTARWKNYFLPHAPYYEALGFIEWMARLYKDDGFREDVAQILEEDHCAYRLVGGFSIVPVASEEEANTLTAAVSDLSHGDQEGSKAHLVGAVSALNAGKYADSVRESVHAVEALLRKMTGKNTFAEAMKELASVRRIHPALKASMEKLYAYSSDENGIRHSLIDEGTAAVTEEEALFMLGVVASFITFVKRSYDQTEPVGKSS